MIKEALQYLAGLAVSSSKDAPIHDVDGRPMMILPKDATLNDMENYLSAPLRKKANIEVRDAESFITYINRHKENGAVLFFNRDQSEMTCALRYHGDTPVWWKEHNVSFHCPTTIEWNHWSGSDGTKMRQNDFAEFMEDNVKDVIQPSSADMLAIAKGFQAKTNVTFNSGVRTDNGDVALEFTTSTTATGGRGSLVIPETFFIGVEVYEGGKSYKVECRLKYRIADGDLTMWYEIVNKDILMRTAFDAELGRVSDGIGAEVMQINGGPVAANR